MPNHTFFNFTWALGTLTEILILIVIFRRKLWREWPSIATYCALSMPFDIALLANTHAPFRRFILYYTWIGIAALLRLWILADVLNSFPGLVLIGTRIRIAVAAIGVVLAAYAWETSASEHFTFSKTVLTIAVRIDRSASIAWGVFFVVILAGLFFFQLGWQRTAGRITTGLAIKLGSAIAVSYVVTIATPPVRNSATYMGATCSVLALSVWLYALLRHQTTCHMEKDGNL